MIKILTAFFFLFISISAEQKPKILLITAESLKTSWKPYAEWKMASGKPTKILTVKQVFDSFEGKDIQEKIRKCVIYHAEKYGVKWIILGGDSDPENPLVPDRDTSHVVMGRLSYSDIPTDQYYVSDKSWDANGDGIYGKWNDDKEAISYGNQWGTCIGRVPVRTAEDVLAFTEKVIEYESNYPENDFAFKMAYTNTTNPSQPKVEKSWKDYVSTCWPKGTGCNFFHTKTPWDSQNPGDYDLLPGNLVDKINANFASKVHMHGHGFLPGWVLENHKLFSKKHIENLKNQKSYLVMTTVSCFTGHFDSKKDPSISESMLRAKNKGAVIVISPAREGVPIFHNPEDFKLMVTEGKLDGTTMTMTRFWVNGLKKQEDGNYLTAGEAFYQAKQEMNNDARKNSGFHWCQSEINFLGDPTLYLRAENPVTPEVFCPKKVKLGNTIKLKTSPGAKVCFWQKGGFYKVVEANENGQASVKFDSNLHSTLKVTVYGANFNTVQIDLLVD